MVYGGERGIRTPDTRKGMADFESAAFNRALPSLRTRQIVDSLSLIANGQLRQCQPSRDAESARTVIPCDRRIPWRRRYTLRNARASRARRRPCSRARS